MSMPEIKQKITVEEFHKLGEMGYFYPDARVELIEGELIHMTPIGMRHAATVSFLTDFFLSKLRGRIILSPQNGLILNQKTEPQPDIVLLKYQSDYYRSRIPAADDVYLVVEVSDTTISYDRNTKVPLYAKAGVPEVWIINLNNDQVELYREPQMEGYQSRTVCRRGEAVSPLAFPEIVLAVDVIMG
ncbi:MAG: Uma2 family endonuclease [bacterium]|jgi:Uma2 family endonuclease